MRTLADDIKKLESEDLSSDYIRTALNHDVSIVEYTDLPQYDSMLELFKDSDNVIVLFPTDAENIGHYVALLYYRDSNSIVYFDPYGMSPYQDIEYSAYLQTRKMKVIAYLPKLLKKFDGQIAVNGVRYQEFRSGIATCGRHCIARIVNRDIVNTFDYKNYLKFKTLTPDEIVSLMY